MPRTYNEVDALVSKEGKLLKKITIQIEGKQDKMVYSVTDIKAIPQDVCNALKVGDIVNKGNHSYRVSFKKSDEGMCLTYVDASRVETQSYDLIGDVWTYNSEDLTEFEDFAKESDLPPTVVANPTLAGTEPPLTGLQVGDTKYKSAEGKKIYQHCITCSSNLGAWLHIMIISDKSTKYNYTTLRDYIKAINTKDNLYLYPINVARAMKNSATYNSIIVGLYVNLSNDALVIRGIQLSDYSTYDDVVPSNPGTFNDSVTEI